MNKVPEIYICRLHFITAQIGWFREDQQLYELCWENVFKNLIPENEMLFMVKIHSVVQARLNYKHFT